MLSRFSLLRYILGHKNIIVLGVTQWCKESFKKNFLDAWIVKIAHFTSLMQSSFFK